MAYEFASRLETFPNYRKFETTFAGRPFVVETGKMCGLSNGSAMIRYGETCVLCNVTTFIACFKEIFQIGRAHV